MKRYLVTSADRDSWPHNVPLIFLGKWCLSEADTASLSGVDYEVADPFWVSGDEKKALIDLNAQITKRVTKDLSVALNALHRENHSERYWSIIVLAWVHKLTSMVSNRYYALKSVIEMTDSIIGTTCIVMSPNELVMNDLKSFIHATATDRWNHHLFSMILKQMSPVYFPINELTDQNSKIPIRSISSWSKKTAHRNLKQNTSNSGLGRLLRQAAKLFFSKVTPKFSSRNDAFIVSTYLPPISEVLLQVLLRQVPQFRQQLPIPIFDPSTTCRENLNLHSEDCSELEKIVRELVPVTIPMCYVEGYKYLQQRISTLNWPENPKFIYTSNNFETDELFKIWTAGKVEEGTPFYVGQHGNNYGSMYGSQYFPEVLNCDKLITWGWSKASGYDEKLLPTFNFKITESRQRRYDPTGKLSLVLRSPGIHWGITDRFYEHSIQQRQSFEFFNSLSDQQQNHTVVRLHHAVIEKNTNDVALWNSQFPDAELNLGNGPMFGLIRRSRLVVFSYDSTGMLETLGLNIPTVCFWSGGVEHLLESAKDAYETLYAVNILFDCPKEAAKHVNAVWGRMSDWWLSAEVQRARQEFCEKYSRTQVRPLFKLKSVLLAGRV